jgi:hypothetical protein
MIVAAVFAEFCYALASEDTKRNSLKMPEVLPFDQRGGGRGGQFLDLFPFLDQATEKPPLVELLADGKQRLAPSVSLAWQHPPAATSASSRLPCRL